MTNQNLPRFFLPHPIEAGHRYLLPESECAHALQVLRLENGDSVLLLNGFGILAKAIIERKGKKQAEVLVESILIEEPTLAPQHTVYYCPVKSADRNEWFVEKAVELGLHRIVFVLCERSERKTMNLEKLEQKACAALKQCGRLTMPIMMEGFSFSEAFSLPDTPEHLYIAYLGKEPQEHLFHHLKKTNGSTGVFIGPEGDFSPNEVALALSKGAIGVGLGSLTLRTETAALAAAHCMVLPS